MSFWRGKRVFVTGHAGFKGSWLVIWLEQMGAEIFGYSLGPYTNDDNYIQASVSNLCQWRVGDILNSKTLSDTLNEFKPEVVFHLAAQPLVRLSYAEPQETFLSNVQGTVNILEACRACPSVRSVVNVTTDKCYLNAEKKDGYVETDPLGGSDPYSASKACSEIITSSYYQSFFQKLRGPHKIGVATARAGNVIGGGDWQLDQLIPDVVRGLQGGKPVVVRNPSAVRPWQHVLDALSGYILLARRLYEAPTDFSGAWNFGPPKSQNVNVESVVTEAIKCWGEGSWEHEVSSNDQLHETHYLALDSTKANEALDWHPAWDFQAAITNTIAWYKCAESDGDLLSLCRGQIENYRKVLESL